jgi:hypothetical protein
MAKWTNGDGLVVKFGQDEADPVKGGEVLTVDGIHQTVFTIDYTDLLSATDSVLGSVGAAQDGAYGIMVPKGARIKGINCLALTAFTSSGTIGSSTLLIGLKKWSDLSTELDHDGFTAAGCVGSRFDAVGERTYVEIGVTGVGALVGTTLAEAGVISVSNSAHGSHPYNGGKMRCTLEWFMDTTV